MKRILVILMTIVLTAGLCACAGEHGQTASSGGNEETAGSTGHAAADTTEAADPGEDKPARVLEVGFGKACITPTEEGIVLKGGVSRGKYDDIYAITTAFRDERGEMYIHIVVDLIAAGMADEDKYATSLGVCDMSRKAIQRELGIDPQNVTVSATHNHSQVEYANTSEPNTHWREYTLLPEIVRSVKDAIDDLAPAKMSIARTRTSHLTFVRRYFLNDGTFYDGYRELRDGDVARHESDADEEVQLVLFEREEKKSILIVNWQTHATKVSSRGDIITSDFVGSLRDKVEAELGVHCVYYQGACGNLAPSSRLAGEAVIPDGGWENAQKLGWAVAAYVIDAFESETFEEVETGLVEKQRITVLGKVKKYAAVGDELYNNALKVIEYGKTAENNYDTARYAAEFGIETIYHAQSIVQNAVLPETKTYELNLISIGDVAFANLPAEYFDTTGMQIKSGSPFKMTLIVAYSCAKGQYVASADAIPHGGYETYKTYFADGTAEITVGYCLDTLKALYPIRKGK